jgi:calcineurin-like phosphoesterase
LSDAGFTGPHDGCLGREIEPVLKNFLTGMPQRFDVARNQVRLHGAIIRIDDASGRAESIQRVAEALD